MALFVTPKGSSASDFSLVKLVSACIILHDFGSCRDIFSHCERRVSGGIVIAVTLLIGSTVIPFDSVFYLTVLAV